MIRPFDTLSGTQVNSVWIVGTMITEPIDFPEHPQTCRFLIQGSHPPTEQPSTFLVEATESAFEGCRPRLHPGKRVRIIGRLHQRRWRDPKGNANEEVKIVSELVEPAGISG